MSRHKDKYRSLVTGRNNRGHRRANGTLKRPYPESEAKAVAERMRDQGRNRTATAYPCTVCDFWHVGASRKVVPRPSQEYTAEVVVEHDPTDGGYVAHDPSRPGCWAQGATQREALERLGEAIAAWETARPTPPRST